MQAGSPISAVGRLSSLDKLLLVAYFGYSIDPNPTEVKRGVTDRMTSRDVRGVSRPANGSGLGARI